MAGALAAVHAHDATAPSVVRMQSRSVSRRGGMTSQGVYLGQQGYNVNFVITNVAYASQVLSFNAAVQDLTTEPLGTADGRTPASDSIKNFSTNCPS